jgi:MoaA/NifB/PqqE/SkfB family radical SAM enzyme
MSDTTLTKAAAPAPYQIDRLGAPLLVSWQLTRDCDLACVHCCTESAPGKVMPGELSRAEALALCDQIIAARVPYVMLCGGEPMVVPHFLEVAERLGAGGVKLKIETNGQKFDADAIARLARLPIRSIQISLDADTPEAYAKQRVGASLEKVHEACRAVLAAGLPLEVTFAPTRINIHEAEAVIARARALGAFRFNSGALMRIGNAAKNWRKLAPDAAQHAALRALFDRESARDDSEMELCYTPFTVSEALERSLEEPPATLLVLPNGWIKASAALPEIVTDLRRETLEGAWAAYRRAWRSDRIRAALTRAAADAAVLEEANNWRMIESMSS